MKATIVLTAILLSTGSLMAQKPDTVPSVNPPLGVDTTMAKADTAVKKTGTDSSLANWKQSQTAPKADTTVSTEKAPAKQKEKVTDRVIMKDGEMLIVKNGEIAKMEKDVTLPSGSVIKKDGTLKKKDGSEIPLKNGQYIEIPSASGKTQKIEKD